MLVELAELERLELLAAFAEHGSKRSEQDVVAPFVECALDHLAEDADVGAELVGLGLAHTRVRCAIFCTDKRIERSIGADWGCSVSGRLLEAREIAAQLGVPKSWVLESARSGAIPCVTSRPPGGALDVRAPVFDHGAMSELAANEELWRQLLTGEGSTFERHRRRHKRIPGSPRCKTCLVPLSGPAARVLRLFTGLAPSGMNPNYCNQCETFVRSHPGGAEIEISLLFADVRGSTALAEQMSAAEFSRVLNRFYDAANRVLIDSDALVDKLVGDEVIGLYLPVLGPEHPRKAALAARDLLQATGHGDPGGPWVPVGAGVHTGTAYVGAVGSQATVSDFTALGDAVNVTARLSSAAAAGEVLISDAAYEAVRADLGGLEARELAVKGRDAPIGVRVLRVAPPEPAAAGAAAEATSGRAP